MTGATGPAPATDGARENQGDPFHLRLYVAGATKTSIEALQLVRRICGDEFAERFRLEVIDLHQLPGTASRDGISVTPTLVRFLPGPHARRLSGDRVLSPAEIRGLLSATVL
jgi:circadian clock protein KaiB